MASELCQWEWGRKRRDPVRIISMRTVVNSPRRSKSNTRRRRDEYFLNFLALPALQSFARQSAREFSSSSSSFSVCHDRQDTNIKVLCKRINALNGTVTGGASARGRVGGVKSDRLISCKSSPNGDSDSEQESELDSHCEPGLLSTHTQRVSHGQRKTNWRGKLHKLLQHPAGNAAAYLSQLSLATASSVGSSVCFKFFSVSALVLMARCNFIQLTKSNLKRIQFTREPV